MYGDGEKKVSSELIVKPSIAPKGEGRNLKQGRKDPLFASS